MFMYMYIHVFIIIIIIIITIHYSRQQIRRGEQLEKIGEGFIADMRPQRGREEAWIHS